MKVRTADGYQDGKAYRVRLSHAEQYADTAYQSTDLVMKVKLVWEGKHGLLSKLFTVPIADGQPVLRPNLGLSRALMAHGFTWDEISAGLDISPVSKAHRTAYASWESFPSIMDHKTPGFQPVRVLVKVDDIPLTGAELIAQVEVNKDGLAQVALLSPLPDDDADDARDAIADEADEADEADDDDGAPDVADLAPARKARR